MYIFLYVVATHSCCRCCCRRSQQIKISEMSLTGEEKKSLNSFSILTRFSLDTLSRETCKAGSSWVSVIYGAPQNWHKIVVKVDWVAGEGKRGKSFDSSTCLFLHSQTGLALSLPSAAAATIGVRTTLIAMIWMLIDLFILVPVNERRATIILCHIAAAKRLEVEQEKMKLMHTITTSEKIEYNQVENGYWCVNTQPATSEKNIDSNQIESRSKGD